MHASSLRSRPARCGGPRRFGPLLALSAVALVACGEPEAVASDAGPPPPDAWMEPPLVEERACPGSAGCESTGDGVLWAGAAAIDITPVAFETFTDTNGDAKWDADEEPFDDANGNGRFDAAWIAGFGNGRAAQGVMNPQWARALVLRVGDVTIAFVALDVVGLFLDETERIRDAVDDEALDVDYVVVGATHAHQARDTIGIWGPSLSETGISEAYQAQLRDGAVQAVREATGALRPANVQYASVLLRDVDTPSDVNRYVGDNRHPNIIDDELRLLRFLEAGSASAEPGSGTTIATLVNFAAHPEYQGSRNPLLSSDWPHWMRAAIEDGIDIGPDGTRVEGVGGTVVFFNGALGSQIGPNRLHVRQWDGTPVIDEDSDESAMTVGTQLGHIALGALRGAGTTTEETADLAFRYRQFYVTVENRRYHIAGTQGIFVRGLYNYDEARLIQSPGNLPDVITEVAVIDVGAATMLTAPGELDPAELIGGYEAPCPHTPGGCDALLEAGTENPPDLSMAPTGPFLRDRLLARRTGAEHVWLLGLTNDFLGYLIPEFDYELGTGIPYITEAPGDHYEETNSIGEHGWPRIRARMIELIEWEPARAE